MFLLSMPGSASMSVSHMAIHSDSNHSLVGVKIRNVGPVNTILHSASNYLVVPIPFDGIPHKISTLIGPSTLAPKAIDGFQYDSVRLLDDERCIFETPTNTLVVGGGLPTSLSIAPPQSILSISCAPDLA